MRNWSVDQIAATYIGLPTSIPDGYFGSEGRRCGLAGAQALRSAEERFQKGSCRAAIFWTERGTQHGALAMP